MAQIPSLEAWVVLVRTKLPVLCEGGWERSAAGLKRVSAVYGFVLLLRVILLCCVLPLLSPNVSYVLYKWQCKLWWFGVIKLRTCDYIWRKAVQWTSFKTKAWSSHYHWEKTSSQHVLLRQPFGNLKSLS